MNEKLFFLTTQKKKTNHILHVIMTVLTGGLWLIVWFFVASSNQGHNKKLDKQINQIMHYKTKVRRVSLGFSRVLIGFSRQPIPRCIMAARTFN